MLSSRYQKMMKSIPYLHVRLTIKETKARYVLSVRLRALLGSMILIIVPNARIRRQRVYVPELINIRAFDFFKNCSSKVADLCLVSLFSVIARWLLESESFTTTL